MKYKSVLKLNMATAMKTLATWKLDYPHSESVNLRFTDNKALGNGFTRYFEYSDSADMYIGTAPLSTSIFNKYIPIKDSDFVIMGVIFFHEMAHYQDHVSENVDRNIMTSDLSVQHNDKYYCIMHHKLPHEINAEYMGVMSMWSALESEWPDVADKLMFDYLNYRTEKYGRTRKIYMIERPEGGFRSKQQVKDLFNEAYEKSLTEKRNLPDGFLTYEGDTSRLLVTDDGRGVRTEYVPVYLKLIKSDTGVDTDRMMASLISHIHPELQNMYTRLDFEELEPDKVFDMAMPEATNESRARLGYDDNFASGVDYVTRLQNEEQKL